MSVVKPVLTFLVINHKATRGPRRLSGEEGLPRELAIETANDLYERYRSDPDRESGVAYMVVELSDAVLLGDFHPKVGDQRIIYQAGSY